MSVVQLNDAQAQAVNTTSKHVLVVAGAGSGKTRVLSQRLVNYFRSRGFLPGEVIALTFTNKAAAEMRTRILEDVDFPGSQLMVGTFHSLANRFLREYGHKIGLEPTFQIIDSEDAKRIVKRILKSMNVHEDLLNEKQAIAYINKHKENGRGFNDLGAFRDQHEATTMEVFAQYEAHKKRSNVLDFADLLLLSYKLWQREDIKAQRPFKAVLVDEFQDTNVVQYLWLKEMVGTDTEVFAVGDDDQSIYGWRGACVDNIRSFEKDFANTEVVRLEQNYRSTNTILSAANEVIANNGARLGKNLWSEQAAGAPIALYGAFNEMEEAQYIANAVRSDISNGISPNDIAILYRSNAQSRVLEQAFRSKDIEYRIYGGLRFYERAEIKDALAYLRLAHNPNDDVAFERVINLPARGIGAKSIEQIREYATAHSISMLRACQLMGDSLRGKAKLGVSEFLTKMEVLHHDRNNMEFSQFIEEMIKSVELARAYENEPQDVQQTRCDNLAELIIATSQFEAEHFESTDVISAFLTDVALDMGSAKDNGLSAVNMMTLHSAKGLEFSSVYIAGMEDGLFPHRRSTETIDLLEEERRLAYVGITRAKKKLSLSYAHKRSFQRTAGVSRPSRFIDEIPKSLIQHVSPDSLPHQNKPFQAAPYHAQQSGYSLGTRVRHPRFGEGVIMSSEGSGEMARLQVQFNDFGAKWLVMAYAKLEVV